jgi:hypothetical protein
MGFIDSLANKKYVRISNIRRIAPITLISIWPFLYFYRYLIPNQPFSLKIENDFIPLYYTYKVYLLDMLSRGHFPLWSPSEAGGYPFYSNPFTQSFYPLNIPLTIVYKVLGGFSIFDYQRFAVLGVVIFSIGIYLWLRLLIPQKRGVIFATLMVGMNFKIGELLRFPNALHTAAWIPWLLWGITLASRKGRLTQGGLITLVSCFMLLSGGYLYYAYYCLFLIPPYATLLLFPFGREALIQDRSFVYQKRPFFLGAISAVSAVSLMLCSPFLMKFNSLMKQTVDRAGTSYQYSVAHHFSLVDTLGSVIFPPAAEAEGWYYFSILGVLLLVIYMTGTFFVRRAASSDMKLHLTLLIWVALISYITYGKNSYLFELLWHYLPGFSSLRSWGRMNIILLPLLSLWLARSYQFIETEMFQAKDDEHRSTQKKWLYFSSIIVVTIGLGLSQAYLFTKKIYDPYWLDFLPQHHGDEYLFIVLTAVSSLLFIIILLWPFKRPCRQSRISNLILFLFLGLAVADLRPVGANQWASPAGLGYGAERVVYNMDEALTKSLSTHRVRKYRMISLTPVFNVGFVQNWYFRRYLDFDQTIFSKDDYNKPTDRSELHWYGLLMGLQGTQSLPGKRLFLSKEIDHTSIKGFIMDSVETESRFVRSLQLKYYNGEILRLAVTNTKPLYISFIDNWDPDWRATVNGQHQPVEKLFGTFKSLGIQAGTHDIIFYYSPFSGRLIP